MNTQIGRCVLGAVRQRKSTAWFSQERAQNLQRLRLLIVLAALCAGVIARAQEDPVERLNVSRQKVHPFRAIYVEELRVLGSLETGGGTKGWGTSNSDLEVEAAIDATASQLRYPVFDKDERGKALSDRFYFNKGSVTYHLVDREMRGYFGKGSSGMINPAAAGYEVSGELAASYFRRHEYRIVNRDEVLVSNEKERTEVKFSSFGDQTVISTVTQESPDGNSTTTEISDWIEREGLRYPKTVSFQFTQNGRVVQRRTYKLRQVLSGAPGALSLALKEGASVKDEDSNIVYIVRGGKLVVDPRFNPESARGTSWRRAILLVGFALLGGWLYLRIRVLKPRSARA